MCDLKAEAKALNDYVLSLRHYFHSHPELGTEEVNTTKRIVAELDKLGVEVLTFPDITGCIGTIRGKGQGKTVMLRADIDALPIQENNHGQTYLSQKEGVMHACGHDCHTAMLLGAAKLLMAHRQEFTGEVQLLFQMAEELGTESRHYVEKGCLKNIDGIFGMHVWALLESGTANFADGERMACSDRITLKIKADKDTLDIKTDPLLAAAEVVTGLQSLVSQDNPYGNSLVLTIGAMNSSGEGRNQEVVLVGTTRTFNKALRKNLPSLIERKARGLAQAHGCDVESTYFFGPAPLINDNLELNALARGAAQKILGDKALVDYAKQMGAEDFSVYMEEIPGVYGFLGVRNGSKGICCVHHHPDFDVDEEVLTDGAAIYAQFALDYLAQCK